MRATFSSVAVAAIVTAAFFLAAESAAQQAADEVEDTVVATDADSRPAFVIEKTDTKPSQPDEPDKAGTPGVSTRKSRARFRARAKDRYSRPDPALELADPRTYRLKVIVRVRATDSPIRSLVATCPIPMNWPEQEVRLLDEQTSPHSHVTEEVLPGQAAILKLQVTEVPAKGVAFVERMYEITRYRTKFTIPGEELSLSKRMPAEMRDQLRGTPPGIEIQHPKMIELAETLRTTSREAGPWETVRAFWSWTRDNVKFENGDFRGAMHAIEQHCGDCEEMSALFVGMCRLSGIPARTVWVHSHDYPEFYLVDKQGRGHWIPAQVLGPPWFGEMAEYRPIFQKGDRFYDSLKKEYVRYVPQTVKGGDARSLPKVEIKHEIIADSDINAPTYNGR